MGVNGLWRVLRNKVGAVHKADRSCLGQLIESTDAHVIAVDLSIWLLALKQVAHRLGLSGTGMCVRVVFERTVNWIRCGVLPVFVLDGPSSPAKERTLKARQTRYQWAHGISKQQPNSQRDDGWFSACCIEVADMLGALGMPVIRARGEADAMCASLNAAGCVDAVASSDADVVLFGAETTYKRLHLSASMPLKSTFECCSLDAVRRWLGIKRGGSKALCAVGILCGGDYNAGAPNVGPARAFEAVRCLLLDSEDDNGILSALHAALRDGPDHALLAIKKCTGCKHCGRDFRTKGLAAKHQRDCGAGTPCQERGPVTCACAFHRLAPQRALAKVVDASSLPDFLRGYDAAVWAYEAEANTAHAAVAALLQQGFRSSWVHRPDLAASARVMGARLGWSMDTVRARLRPLQIEFDLLQGPNPEAPVAWVPTTILRLGRNAGIPWRFALHLQRIPGAIKKNEDEAADISWLNRHSCLDVSCSHLTPTRTWMVRTSLMKQAWPSMVTCFDRSSQGPSSQQGRPSQAVSPGDPSMHGAVSPACQQQDLGLNPFSRFIFSPVKHVNSSKQQQESREQDEEHCGADTRAPPSTPKRACLAAAHPSSPLSPCKRPLRSILQSPSKRCIACSKEEDDQAGIVAPA